MEEKRKQKLQKKGRNENVEELKKEAKERKLNNENKYPH